MVGLDGCKPWLRLEATLISTESYHMQVKWKTKAVYPLYSPFPVFLYSDSHEQKQLLHLFSMHLEALVFETRLMTLPFIPLFVLKWHTELYHTSALQRAVDTSPGLNQGCASDSSNSMEATSSCIGFKTSVSKPLKLVGGFATRKMAAEQKGTKGVQCKRTSYLYWRSIKYTTIKKI